MDPIYSISPTSTRWQPNNGMEKKTFFPNLNQAVISPFYFRIPNPITAKRLIIVERGGRRGKRHGRTNREPWERSCATSTRSSTGASLPRTSSPHAHGKEFHGLIADSISRSPPTIRFSWVPSWTPRWGGGLAGAGWGGEFSRGRDRRPKLRSLRG